MKVIKRGGHYIVEDMINGVLVSEKFLVGSKKEAIKKFKEKHKHIVIKDHQYEINADGTETDTERYGKGEINE